ncbi:MAG: heme o synthase [Pseudomonadota bacterium]
MLAAARVTMTLLKLPIGLAIAASALIGMLAADGALSPARGLFFALAVLGASGAAGAFNHYHERALDRMMGRTKARPFAAGLLKPGAIWPVSFLALLAAALMLAWAVGGGLAALLVFLGAFTYGVVYTVWLKRRSAWNIVVGGLAGSFAILAGAAAVAPALQPVPLILALVMFLWTPPHFWSLAAARAEDYRAAGVPMLPVVAPPRLWTPVILGHSAVLAALSLAPLWFGLGPVYGLFAGAGGGLFLWRSWRLFRSPGRAAAIANFTASLWQFALLATGVLLDALVQGAF